MKNKCFFTVIMAISCLIGISHAEEKEKMHPYNRFLLNNYPRTGKFYYQSVPRITPKAALDLLRTNQAFFIRVGDEGMIVLGCLTLEESETWKINVKKLMDMLPHKYVILY